MKIQDATLIVDWRHPGLGEITEWLCQVHRTEVMAAIRVLGIGCGGRPVPTGYYCTRCMADAQSIDTRDYLNTRTEK